MIYVTFQDGTVRQYNRGFSVLEDGAWTKIGTKAQVDSNILCKIRSCDIARIEWELPCKVWRVSKTRKRRVQ